MARAKRTDRAEARRRFRAQQAAADAEFDDESDDEAAPSARPPAPSAPTRGAQPAPAPRPGIGSAFRGAFRSANLREDLAHLPQIFMARSMWLTALLVIAIVGTILAFEGQEVITKVLFPYFLLPPQIGAIFIVGFFAPRASYLSGALIAAFATTCLAVAVVMSPLAVARALGYTGLADPSASPAPSGAPSAAPSPAGSPSPVATNAAPTVSGSAAAPSGSAVPSAEPSASPTPRLPTPQDLRNGIAESYITAVLGGVMFASAAAWYKRFLHLANPNRGRRPPPGRNNRASTRGGPRR